MDPGPPDDPELQALLDRSRADAAAQSRIRERWLRRQAIEDATFAGVLVDLAQRGLPVSVHTTARRVHHGAVITVGADFCAVATESGAVVHVRLDAVAMVRPQRGFRHGPASGAGEPGRRAEQTFVHALARAAEQRPRVQVAAATGEVVSGELEHVGADVVTLRLDDGERVYLPAGAITELTS
jgi:hypothetical protein